MGPHTAYCADLGSEQVILTNWRASQIDTGNDPSENK